MGCQIKNNTIIISFLPLLLLLATTTAVVVVDATNNKKDDVVVVVGSSSSSSSEFRQRKLRRRRLVGGSSSGRQQQNHEQQQPQQQHDPLRKTWKGEQTPEEEEEDETKTTPKLNKQYDDEKTKGSSSSSSFYDFSHMKEDAKLDMIKKAYVLTQYGDSVDWDAQREKYIETVRTDRSRSRSQSADDANGNGDDAYDGRMDDTLTLLDGETVHWKGRNGSSEGNTEENHVSDDDDADDDDALDSKSILTTEMESQTINPKKASSPRISSSSSSSSPQQPRRLQKNNIDGNVFAGYEYSRGACPAAGSQGVPCAPQNLSALCNKYNRKRSSFSACIEACTPAFCCIHDAPPDLNQFAPNCRLDENCDQYNYCYIAWWKLHDTVGPALFLRVEQDDEFYDLDAEDIAADSSGSPLFTQVLLHHFDDMEQVIIDGTVGNGFNADRIFQNEAYWVYPETNKVVISEFN